MDNDLLLVGEAQSVLANECDSEGDAVHGLFPARPVNKFILRLRGIDSEHRRGPLRLHLLRLNHIKGTKPPGTRGGGGVPTKPWLSGSMTMI